MTQIHDPDLADTVARITSAMPTAIQVTPEADDAAWAAGTEPQPEAG